MKMEIKTKVRLIVSCISCLCLSTIQQQVACNPLSFNPYFAYSSPYHSMALQSQMMNYPQYDPYAAMQSQYLMSAQPMNIWPQLGDASRRSLQGMFGRMSDKMSAHNNKQQAEQPESDEQKALDGLPMNLIEPDPPSTITERISESFSALNEGVKNHFRSISENFSDTLDDIKDAWKPAEKDSKKRKS